MECVVLFKPSTTMVTKSIARESIQESCIKYEVILAKYTASKQQAEEALRLLKPVFEDTNKVVFSIKAHEEASILAMRLCHIVRASSDKIIEYNLKIADCAHETYFARRTVSA